MRYLRNFNEGSFLPTDLNDLQYFCETYLAYLLDEGFGIRVRHGSRKDRARIEFYKDDVNLPGRITASHFPAPFNWDDVKDHYIPFYQMLSKEYEISTTPSRITNGEVEYKECAVKFEYRKPGKQLWETEAKWFTEQEIINDKVGNLGSYVGVISIFLYKN
jgi:hypothetical protein